MSESDAVAAMLANWQTIKMSEESKRRDVTALPQADWGNVCAESAK